MLCHVIPSSCCCRPRATPETVSQPWRTCPCLMSTHNWWHNWKHDLQVIESLAACALQPSKCLFNSGRHHNVSAATAVACSTQLLTIQRVLLSTIQRVYSKMWGTRSFGLKRFPYHVWSTWKKWMEWHRALAEHDRYATILAYWVFEASGVLTHLQNIICIEKWTQNTPPITLLTFVHSHSLQRSDHAFAAALAKTGSRLLPGCAALSPYPPSKSNPAPPSHVAM